MFPLRTEKAALAETLATKLSENEQAPTCP